MSGFLGVMGLLICCKSGGPLLEHSLERKRIGVKPYRMSTTTLLDQSLQDRGLRVYSKSIESITLG